jgi:hypothetical protein
MRRCSTAALASVLLAGMFTLGGAGQADADTVPCPNGGRRFFAVDGTVGELHEVCQVQATVVDLGVADTDDWRGYQQVTASAVGEVTEIFAVTGDGRLLRRSRPALGQPFGPPTRIGAEFDWSTAVAVLASADDIVVQFAGSPVVRVFALTTGELVEGQPLFEPFDAPPLSGLSAGFAEINHDGLHFRVYRAPYTSGGRTEHSYFSGALPGGLQGVTGTENTLVGLDTDGRIATLQQDWRSLEPPYKRLNCYFNHRPWTVAATSEATGFVRLVVPGRSGAFVTTPPSTADCPRGVEPWEWQ